MWISLFLSLQLTYAEPDRNPTVPDTTSQNAEDDDVSTDTEETDTGFEVTTADLLAQIDLKAFDIPIVINDEVIYWVDHFSTHGRWSVSKWIRASGKYRNLIQNELKDAGLPKDLLYLAMLESGFNPSAQSQASAVGIWQFIPSTGAEYGLIINENIDERRDPTKATKAAIAYLNKLYREFGNWHLTLAAYNTGEANIYKAISAHGTINYWELRSLNAFALETENYVPRILALAILDKNRELFGIPQVEKLAEPLIIKKSSAPQNAHISTLADAAQMSMEAFLEYNPHILKERFFIDEDQGIIYLPPEKSEVYLSNMRQNGPTRLSSGVQLSKEQMAELKESQQSNELNEPIRTTDYKRQFTHVVEEMDSWESLEHQYQIPIEQLKEWNNHQDLVVGSEIRLSKPKVKTFQPYTVKAGESLKIIAKKHDCTIQDIRTWNGLDDDATIQKGDVLYLQMP